MVISTRAQDHRESDPGIGDRGGSWRDTGFDAETPLTSTPPTVPDPEGLTLDLNSAVSADGIPVMVDSKETELEAVKIPETPVQTMTDGLGGVAVDSVKLVELQVQLVETELKQSVQRLVQPIGILLTGAACGTASLMMLFHAAGWALHDIFGLSVSLSLFLVTILGAVLTYITMQTAWTQLKEPRISFAKSKAELMQNLRCYANLLGPSK